MPHRSDQEVPNFLWQFMLQMRFQQLAHGDERRDGGSAPAGDEVVQAPVGYAPNLGRWASLDYDHAEGFASVSP
jgi:hypothetical protein